MDSDPTSLSWFACFPKEKRTLSSGEKFSPFTGTSSIGNSAIFENGGKVGIGNTSPVGTLDVSGNTFVRGTLSLSQTTSAAVGVINMGSSPFIHACCSSSKDNTFVGISAGNFATTGFHNTANGFDALHANTTGAENTATGYQALFSNTNGSSNTADGHEALISNTSGFNNTASGFSALLSNGTGHDNTASGDSALASNTTGSFNTAVGETALSGNTTGNFNTALGYAAQVGSGNLANATAIGVFATVAESNALVFGCVPANCPTGTTPPKVGIGTTTPFATLDITAPNQVGLFDRGPFSGVGAGLDLQTTGTGGLQWEILDTGALAAQGPNKLNIRNVNTGNDVLTILANGQVGIETTAPDNTLTVNGSADKPGGGSWGTFSDRRLKTIHGSYQSGLSQILKLNPVRYRYRQENPLGIRDGEEHVGLVAQEVQKVIPEAVSANSQGYLLVNNDPIVWSMLNAIKQQQQQIQQQQTRMAKLTRELQNVRHVQAENTSLRRELLRIAAEVKQIRARLQPEQAQFAQLAAHAGGN